uniref:Uncharacterized protein n=1 Tax=Pavo cristatus TaxID=9049 RepID=A0A8C9F501_PAVCR
LSTHKPFCLYIFGEFSPDEFNQFFVTPRCSVEVRYTFSYQHFKLLSPRILRKHEPSV